MTSEQFKKAREAKGMTQKGLASYLGASYSTVTKWEVGKNPIPAWVEEKLTVRKALTLKDLDADEIAAFEKKAAEKGKSPDSIASELIRLFIKMPIL